MSLKKNRTDVRNVDATFKLPPQDACALQCPESVVTVALGVAVTDDGHRPSLQCRCCLGHHLRRCRIVTPAFEGTFARRHARHCPPPPSRLHQVP